MRKNENELHQNILHVHAKSDVFQSDFDFTLPFFFSFFFFTEQEKCSSIKERITESPEQTGQV